VSSRTVAWWPSTRRPSARYSGSLATVHLRPAASSDEISELVGQIAPQLLSEPGFGPLIAAKLVGEIAGAQRFATPARLARAAGVAPIPASSGNTQRQRLDRGGNRQINAALHRVIVT